MDLHTDIKILKTASLLSSITEVGLWYTITKCSSHDGFVRCAKKGFYDFIRDCGTIKKIKYVLE